MIIKENQSPFDISTQTSGDVRSVFDFCLLNEIGFTDDIPAGSDFSIPVDTEFLNENIINYFDSKNIELVTGDVIVETELLGIGTMIIETNFDVF